MANWLPFLEVITVVEVLAYLSIGRNTVAGQRGIHTRLPPTTKIFDLWHYVSIIVSVNKKNDIPTI